MSQDSNIQDEDYEALLSRTLDLFSGDAQAAKQWLDTPRDILGGVSPLARAQSKEGLIEVYDLIGRLKHGVF